MSKIDRTKMTREIVEAGNRLQSAITEDDKHAAGIAMLRLRLAFFNGDDAFPFRDFELDELCAKLTSREIRMVMDWCWGSYTGGMQHMRETS